MDVEKRIIHLEKVIKHLSQALLHSMELNNNQYLQLCLTAENRKSLENCKKELHHVNTLLKN